MQVEFLDVNITMAPDKQSAVADLTAKGKVPGDKDILVQELKMKLKKIGRQWYLQKVETVKSLSKTNCCRSLDFCVLELGAWDFPGAWRLGLGAFPRIA